MSFLQIIIKSLGLLKVFKVLKILLIKSTSELYLSFYSKSKIQSNYQAKIFINSIASKDIFKDVFENNKIFAKIYIKICKRNKAVA